MTEYVNIHSLDGDFTNFRFYLDYIKETAKSIYCESSLYGDTYRIEKKSGKVLCNGKQIANTSEYVLL